MTPTLGVEPACPGVADATASRSGGPSRSSRPLRAERRPFATFDRGAWDALANATPWATPFSRWSFHRAWWDAYGPNAHDDTLALVDASSGELVGIAPLMHRHEVEAGDAAAHTALRSDPVAPLTPVAPTATAVFFGASYHADYATLLVPPGELPAAAEAVAAWLASPTPASGGGPTAWDAVDLRRLRCGDPAADELAAAFLRREAEEGWTLNVEREDVCPVVTLPAGATFESFLDGLGKKERHEIRRKVRRAEGAGEVRLDRSDDPLADLDAFIDLHQRRWGADGLFPPTAGGGASRRFVRRLFELAGMDGHVHLSFLTVAGRRIAAGIHLEDRTGILYYNAGVDPDARELSPGVVLVARYIADAIERGHRRFDFLRGDEPYKYEWGAVDEPIQRLLVRRTP